MTKIITIIIIVSTVWSVISGLIEKHKKDKLASKSGGISERKQLHQKNLRVSAQPQSPTELFDARVNALRQRPPKRVVVPKPELTQKVQETKETRIEAIKPLHQQDCPLPPKQRHRPRKTRAGAVSSILKAPRGIKTAVILTELLRRPVSQR